MPKSMKAAPPQQSSLNELWSGRGKAPIKSGESVQTTSNPKRDNMDIDAEKSQGNPAKGMQ